MIIATVRGNIFDCDAQTLVCPVNIEGTLGAGLALQFRKRYPDLLPAYRAACRAGVFNRHGIFVYSVSDERKVVCLATKQRWRNPARLEWVERGLFYLVRDYEEYGITSIAVPPLGCGCGRLRWKDVYPLMKRYLVGIPIPVTIYLP